ncbi:hypothetical protein [Moraxella sp. RCAD0137]|uniref:hypothetical protein n=1 Tax=Moraxella sp. RCAD0137 TaxID=1775913 RepID=UPI000C9FCF0B|nr:hypothetical protein [Moraxella sp. RCAD0137]PNP97424.1 hypothetical protein AZ602_07520 [Moraxella sp. RCAD0137]
MELIILWMASSAVLFILYHIHLQYSLYSLGHGYWIGWAISWDFFVCCAIFFITSLILSRANTRHRLIVGYIIPLLISLSVFFIIPQNSYLHLFDSRQTAFDDIIRLTPIYCLVMLISNIFWINQQSKIYFKYQANAGIIFLIILINIIFLLFWAFMEIIAGM